MSDAQAGLGPHQLLNAGACGAVPCALLAGALVSCGGAPRVALAVGVPLGVALAAGRLVEHAVRGRSALARVWITGLVTWAALAAASAAARVGAEPHGAGPVGLEGLELGSALEGLLWGLLGGYPLALARADAQAPLPSRGGVLLLGSLGGAELLALTMGLWEGARAGLPPFVAWVTLGGLVLGSLVLVTATACRLALGLQDLLIAQLLRKDAS